MPRKLPSNVCFLCLSTDRNIFHLPDRHRRLFRFLTDGYPQSYARVCWECRGSLQRLYNFKEQAERAARALESFRTGSQPVNLQCLSRLCGAQMVIIDLLVPENLHVDTSRMLKIVKQSSEVCRKDEEPHVEYLGADAIDIDPISNTIYIKDTSSVDVKIKYEQSDDNKPDDENVESESIDVAANEIKRLIYVNGESSVGCSALAADTPPTKTEKLKLEIGLLDELNNLLDDSNSESVKEEPVGSETRQSAHQDGRERHQSSLKSKINKYALKRVLCGVNCERRKSTAGNKYKRWYKCLACERSYESEEDWRNHDLEVHPMGAEPTCSCYRKKSKSEVKQNVKVDLPARNLETGTLDCVICGSKLKTIQSYQRHYRSHVSTERYECDICSKVFKTRLQIQSHFRLHYPSKFLCNICGKRLLNQHSLSVHMYAHSSVESRPYKCDICPKKFIASDKLRIHKLHHTGVRDFVCHLCPAAYYVKFELTRHLGKIHGISNSDSTYKKKFVNRTPSMARNKNFERSLNPRKSNKGSRQGRSKEDKEQNLLCNICGKKFASYMCLSAHKVVHTGARPYKCPKCEQRFKFQSNVLTHVRSMHTAEKEHECVTCGASFRLKGNLTAHMKLHTGEKPYACDICNQKFLRNRNLRNHYKVHSQPN